MINKIFQMLRKCCVSGCKTNHDSREATEDSVFIFPRNKFSRLNFKSGKVKIQFIIFLYQLFV